jgi:hypothetical protein
MSTSNPFSDKFRSLLTEIPDGYSLEQWQYLYRDVIFSMGVRILERFNHRAIGPDPFAGATTAGDAPGSHGPGYNPGPMGGSPPQGNSGPGATPSPSPSPSPGDPRGPRLDGSHGPGYSPSIVIARLALEINVPPKIP